MPQPLYNRMHHNAHVHDMRAVTISRMPPGLGASYRANMSSYTWIDLPHGI